MIKWLILFICLSFNAYAGMGVEHDGNGNIVRVDLDANPQYYKSGVNRIYYEHGKDGVDSKKCDRDWETYK